MLESKSSPTASMLTPKIGDSFAVWSPKAPCGSETEPLGTNEVWFEGTNPTCCSSSGRAVTAPDMTFVIQSPVCMYTDGKLLMYCQIDEKIG